MMTNKQIMEWIDERMQQRRVRDDYSDRAMTALHIVQFEGGDLYEQKTTYTNEYRDECRTEVWINGALEHTEHLRSGFNDSGAWGWWAVA